MKSTNWKIIDFNLQHNKNLFNKINHFLIDLNSDQKTQFFTKINTTYIMVQDNDIYKIDPYIIRKDEVLEFMRLRILLTVFLNTTKDTITAFNEFDMSYRFDKFIRVTRFYLDYYSEKKNEKTSNEYYLYNDFMGLFTTNQLNYFDTFLRTSLKDYEISVNINPIGPYNYSYKINVNIHPIVTLLQLIQHSNIHDNFSWLLIFFSMLKLKWNVKNKLEEVKRFTNLSEIIDFLVNSNLDENDYQDNDAEDISFWQERSLISKIKQFQYFIKEGYFNKEDLINILQQFVLSRVSRISNEDFIKVEKYF